MRCAEFPSRTRKSKSPFARKRRRSTPCKRSPDEPNARAGSTRSPNQEKTMAQAPSEDDETSDPLLGRVDVLKQKVEALEKLGGTDAELIDLRSHLARLTLAVIVSELSKEDAAYVDAMGELDRAIDALDAADESSTVATAISVAAKSVALVEK